jgi:hypothetical protein
MVFQYVEASDHTKMIKEIANIFTIVSKKNENVERTS